MRLNRNVYSPQKSEASFTQERDRSNIPDKYKWNLADIYPSDDAWRSAKDNLVAEFPKVDRFRGKLAQSPAMLAECMETVSAGLEPHADQDLIGPGNDNGARRRRESLLMLVGGAGFEPATPAV